MLCVIEIVEIGDEEGIRHTRAMGEYYGTDATDGTDVTTHLENEIDDEEPKQLRPVTLQNVQAIIDVLVLCVGPVTMSPVP